MGLEKGGLHLRAGESIEDGSTAYNFEIVRNGARAYHLSEGECSLIAFCYFVAKLEDIHTKGETPIIWIDDPISSLDSNHIFFIYSLINAVIIEPKNFKQIFISTHNLDFLKYLKKLPGADRNKEALYFMINRQGESSCINLMPSYMKEYVTEFNFLFHQIYKCASIKTVTDDNYTVFYNFGNNARKFLEIYLYYKYPDGTKNNEKERLSDFFGANTIAVAFIERINNEYSHLSGVFERGASPIQETEMKKVALSILMTIKEKDKEQYQSFLNSVGEDDILT